MQPLKATQFIVLQKIIHLKYWRYLLHLVNALLKRHQEMIRVLLKKKKHKQTKQNTNLLPEADLGLLQHPRWSAL